MAEKGFRLTVLTQEKATVDTTVSSITAPGTAPPAHVVACDQTPPAAVTPTLGGGGSSSITADAPRSNERLTEPPF